MKLLFFSDLHLAERPPLARGESYVEDLFAKLEELREMAGDCHVTVFGGDLLHWPRPTETSHRLVRRLIELLRTWPVPLFLIAGNHDLPPEQLAGLSRTALGVVLEALRDSPVRLLDEDRVIVFDMAPGALRPVDPSGAISDPLRVQLSPAHWQHDIDQRPELYGLTRMPDVDFAVKVAHGMVMLPGGGWPFPATGMDQIPTVGMDAFLWGHTHWQTGVHCVNDTWFASPGAIARTARSPDERERHVMALIVTFERGHPLTLASFQEVPLASMRPADDVFVWQEQGDRAASGLFAGYVAALESGLDVQGLSIEDALAALEKQAQPEVAKLAREYLEKAGLG